MLQQLTCTQLILFRSSLTKNMSRWKKMSVVSLVPLLLLSPALAKVASPSSGKSQEAGVKFLDPYVGSYQVHHHHHQWPLPGWPLIPGGGLVSVPVVRSGVQLGVWSGAESGQGKLLRGLPRPRREPRHQQVHQGLPLGQVLGHVPGQIQLLSVQVRITFSSEFPFILSYELYL